MRFGAQAPKLGRPDQSWYRPREMRQKVVRLAIRLVGPVLLAIVLWRLGDRAAIVRMLRDADPLSLAVALALTFANLELKVIRWDALLRARGIRYPLRRARMAYFASSYVGTLTPGRVGDVLRVQYLRRDLGVPYAEGLASVVMDRVCDLYVLAGFVALGVVRFSSVVVGRLAVVAWLGVAVTTLGPLVLLVPTIANAFVRIAYKRFARADGAAGLERFFEAIQTNVGMSLGVTIPLTIAAFAINYVQGWLMARAIHAPLSFYDVTCLMAIASLLGLLPISVSGIGVRELFFAVAFPTLGYGAEVGVSFGLMVFVVIYLAMVVIGFASWQIAPPPAANASVEAGSRDR